MNGLPEATFCKINLWPTVMGACPLFPAPVKTQPSALQNFQLHVSLWAEHRSLNPGLGMDGSWQNQICSCSCSSSFVCSALSRSHWYLVRATEFGSPVPHPRTPPPPSTNQQAAHGNSKCSWFLKKIHTDCVSFSPWVKSGALNLLLKTWTKYHID